MKERIIELLSQKIDKDLVTDLVNSYEAFKNAYVLDDHESSLSKSGKFVENVFRVLYFIKSGKVLMEIKQNQINDLTKDLLNADGSKFPESIRILIPNIANSLIYQPRSKLGAVHVKPISPDEIDAKLCVSAADWIVAELLRLYHDRDADKVKTLIRDVTKEHIPVIKKIGEEKFVTIDGDCQTEISLYLYDAQDGLSRNEIGKSVRSHKPPRITEALTKMLKTKDVFLTRERKYHLSDRKKKDIAKIILESSN